MNRFLDHWFTYSVMIVWLLLCIICQKADIISVCSNKGIAMIGNEYYRFATSLFVHKNFIHLLVNATALFFIGSYLEPQISPVKLLAFSLFVGILTQLLFALVFRQSISFGGSPMVFSLIGLIVIMNATKAAKMEFALGTWYGNWILGYAILANIPLFSDSFISTIFVHGVSLILGIFLGYLGIAIRVL